ncbi:hypothetical protein EJ07DRAFT_154155 [Lizonia empirigonia]|nr:hypothetical protein EJ07DRAFT_154155 [Lizonia empirigonia]
MPSNAEDLCSKAPTDALFDNNNSPFDHVFDQETLQLLTSAPPGYDSTIAPTALAFNIVPNVVSTTTEDVLIAPALTHIQKGARPFGRHVIDHGLAPTQGAQSATSLDSSSTSTPVQGRFSNNLNTHSNAAQVNHCPHGCPKPLHRAGDYRRHMRKHQKPRFKCPDIDCDKTFYRADKMRDHIRQGHKGLKL